MSIPKTVVERVATFRNYIDTYKETSYKETSLCTDFIDPLFEALGWDISNKDGKPERYRDVEQQYSQRMQGSGTKKPDYLFRIGGAPAFFLETKKPSVNILDDKDSAYQLRRYGWNNDTIYVSILSNFEYLSLYDVRVQPKDKSDRPHVGLLRKYHFEDYIKKWDEIEGYLGRENVARGSLDKLLDDYQHLVKGKREPVDETLLKMIEGWREKLATNIALKNKGLDVYLLNSVVQRTIDRILFLRIAEDRGIENRKEFKLDEAMKGKNVYSKLIAIYDHADTKYNSGLFHFKKETDNYTKYIKIDDTVLKEIIDNLYPPYYNFDFSILPVDILGHVYEKFLGRVITLDDSHQVTIKEKPEVRKAGGVYYTPKYIVDYIVNNTVGKLLEGKTPKQASKLKILDPACGSGSFLLGAFQHLIDWHVEWYTNNEPEKYAKKKNPPIYKIKGGWRLSTEKKKEILLNNIYGVDIDTQAVEVAKLNLLLKVLEEENNPDLGMKRALPDLGNNIKCGNSLIESDFYNDHPDMICDMEQSRKINAFDWDKQFPEIIKWKNSRHSKLDLESPSRELEKGYGFDAVIGNPPYVRQESLTGIKDYLQRSFEVYNGIADLYVYFFERSISLLKPDGKFGYIVANKWLRAKYGKSLRDYLDGIQIDTLIDFGDLPVFGDVSTYPCVIIINKNKRETSVIVSKPENLNFDDLEIYVSANNFEVSKVSLTSERWSLIDVKSQNLIDKLKEGSIPLAQYVDGKIFYGIKSGCNEVFIIPKETRDELVRKDPKNDEIIKRVIGGKDIKKYKDLKPEKYLVLTLQGADIEKYPSVRKYLETFKKRLMPKPNGYSGKWDGRAPGTYEWFELQAPISYQNEFEKPKIMFPDISLRGNFALDQEGGLYCSTSASFIGSDCKYLLGVLNATVTNFAFRSISASYRGGYLRFKYVYLAEVPIKTLDLKNPSEKKKHDKMVQLVETMLELNKQLAETKTSHEKDLLNRQIEMTDKMIDDLVYELYELTSEEIKIVEDSLKQ